MSLVVAEKKSGLKCSRLTPTLYEDESEFLKGPKGGAYYTKRRLFYRCKWSSFKLQPLLTIINLPLCILPFQRPFFHVDTGYPFDFPSQSVPNLWIFLGQVETCHILVNSIPSDVPLSSSINLHCQLLFDEHQSMEK